MERIIDSLLELARLSRLELRPAAVDLSALARELAGELGKREPGRAVELVIAPGLAAKGDAELLRLALGNLLENAWKFTSRRPSARVELGAAREEGQRAFFVSDDGAGFDMARSERLFKPFERLHSEAEFPGFGVGLSLAARIIARHGGKIWARSAPERGATFFFTLPGSPAPAAR